MSGMSRAGEVWPPERSDEPRALLSRRRQGLRRAVPVAKVSRVSLYP